MGKFKAETLKASLKMASIRLNLLKNKRANAIAAKKDLIANYLRAGNTEIALINVESVINDEDYISVFEILSIMCSQCFERIRVISEFTDPPRDMLASIHTLIYAAPYADCEELSKVKEQFGYRYSKHMVQAASENRDGFVNSSVETKLRTTIPDQSLKENKLLEIAAERGLDCGIRPPPMPVSSYVEARCRLVKHAAQCSLPLPFHSARYDASYAQPRPIRRVIAASRTSARSIYSSTGEYDAPFSASWLFTAPRRVVSLTSGKLRPVPRSVS